MVLSERHVQTLKDIHRYSRIKRFHGLMPRKQTLLYEEGVVDVLVEAGLVEEGVIQTRCGSNPLGYRLSEKGREDLKRLGADCSTREWRVLCEEGSALLDDLEEGDIDMLMDIHHLSQLKRFDGMAPKFIMEKYCSSQLKALYDLGYILYIKLKGPEVTCDKGYVLSEKAQKLLRHVGVNI